METYELIRRSVLVEGTSHRETAREFGVNRRTVKKIAENPVPPGYRIQQPRSKPKLGAFVGKIEELLAADEAAPRKQRHTATRIYERLRDEFGYEGGPCQVRRAIKVVGL